MPAVAAQGAVDLGVLRIEAAGDELVILALGIVHRRERDTRRRFDRITVDAGADAGEGHRPRPRAGRDLGIGMIHQELNLFPNLNVAENIFVAREITTGHVHVDHRAQVQEAQKLLDRLEADIDPDNAASLALLRKFGFREEGRFRERWLLGEEWRDSIMMALLATDWRLSRTR